MPQPVRLAGSRNLRRLVEVLRDGAEHSTLDIAREASLPDPATWIRTLAGWPNNIPVEHRREGNLHYYRLGPMARLRCLIVMAEQEARP